MRFFVQDKLSLTLTVIGVLLSRRRHPMFASLAGLYVVYALGIPMINTLKVIFLKDLGFLRGYQFDRFYELVPFFAALSGALGLDQLLKRADPWFAGRKGLGRFHRSGRGVRSVLSVVFVVLGILTLNAKKLHVYTWITDGSYDG